MADIKTSLARLYPPLPTPPTNYRLSTISALYEEYATRLEGTSVTDPLGREIHFLAENFPHLVKLEFFNAKMQTWVGARAQIVIEQLKNRKFNEIQYRIADSSRSRTLFWVPQVLENPDAIFDNKRNNGTDVYIKRYRRPQGASIKLALVSTRGDGIKVIVTSFWCDDKYLAGCVKTPPKHSGVK